MEIISERKQTKTEGGKKYFRDETQHNMKETRSCYRIEIQTKIINTRK